MFKNQFIMKRDLVLSFFLVASICLSTSCANESSEKETQEEAPIVIIEEDDMVEDEAFDFFLPSSIQIAHILKKSGVLYQDGLTNDPEKYSQYETRANRLLNLGVYTGDLAYCILNSQNDKGLTYVAALKSWLTNLI